MYRGTSISDMETTTVYRVAHKTHKDSVTECHSGPYTIKGPAPDINMIITHRHPSPRDDGIDNLESWHIFGFASMDALMNWFMGELGVLAEADFHVEVWEVLSVTFGRKQLAFDRTSGSVVRHVTLDNYCVYA